jgi:hypothetical protein
MPTIDEQLALRGRLQAAEDDLIAARKQHVTIDGTQGIFNWVRHGALSKGAEVAVVRLHPGNRRHDRLSGMERHRRRDRSRNMGVEAALKRGYGGHVTAARTSPETGR